MVGNLEIYTSKLLEIRRNYQDLFCLLRLALVSGIWWPSFRLSWLIIMTLSWLQDNFISCQIKLIIVQWVLPRILPLKKCIGSTNAPLIKEGQRGEGGKQSQINECSLENWGRFQPFLFPIRPLLASTNVQEVLNSITSNAQDWSCQRWCISGCQNENNDRIERFLAGDRSGWN